MSKLPQLLSSLERCYLTSVFLSNTVLITSWVSGVRRRIHRRCRECLFRAVLGDAPARSLGSALSPKAPRHDVIVTVPPLERGHREE